ncbi:unnamed protein product [Pleuronectes platessa]|uniref:Major facilitator superfamily (MFS) profile domain-containing protein n=1 Tax=Pleuronectes platessa TaxID=8262 RepID=A0A9N7Z403_PLEPL|nr:unnamed protein product [Pleuronectes platessa]
MAPVPPGIRLLVSFDRNQWYRALTFILTFLLYTSFHLSRKPISIIKSELHKNCSSVSEMSTASSSSQQASLPSLHNDMDCSWKPFDKSNYKQLLGAMDYSFLCAYAVGMYLSGIIGERLPIRLYLTVGMLASGLFTCLFGLGYLYNIHSLGFYISIQVANGLVQTTGWPSVVTCIGNWFGKGRRGLIMGLWNSHTSVGNILGSLIAGYWVSSNWGLSFIVPGIIIATMGVVCFFFLIEHPNDLKSMYAQNSPPGKSLGVNGHHEVYLQHKNNKSQSYDVELLLPRDRVCVPVQPVVVVKSESEPSAISFGGALQIPGVIDFSLCLLFAKLVSYTFLFWLPLYITKADLLRLTCFEGPAPLSSLPPLIESMVSNHPDHDPPSRPDATPVLSHRPPPPTRTHHEPPPQSWSTARAQCQRDTGSATSTSISPHNSESATLDPTLRPPVHDPQTAIHGAVTEALDLRYTCCGILDKL